MADAENGRHPGHLDESEKADEITVGEAQGENQRGARAGPEEEERHGSQKKEGTANNLHRKDGGERRKNEGRGAAAIKVDDKRSNHRAEAEIDDGHRRSCR